MATVIDALIVTLGLDSSKFTQGEKKVQTDLQKTKEAAAKQAKDIEAAGKKASEFYRTMRNEVIGLFAVFTAGRGIKDFVRDITTGDAATGRLANNLGIAIDVLGAWEGAVERAGGTASGFDSSVQSLTNEFQQLALTGQSSVVPYFRALGIRISDAAGNLRPMNDLLLDFADRTQGMDPRRAQALGAGIRLDPGTINLLMQGRAAVADYLEQQRKLGVVSEADAKKAQQLENAYKDFKQAVTNTARSILNELSPAIIEIMQRFDAWLQSDDGQKFRKDFVAGVVEFATNIRDAAVHVDHVVEALGGWVKVSETLFGLWAGSKFLGMLANVRLLAAALGLGGGAGGAGGAAAAAEGGLLATLLKWGGRLATPAAFLTTFFKGGDLGANNGEDEELARRRRDGTLTPGQGPGYAGAPPPSKPRTFADWWHDHAPPFLGGSVAPGVNPSAPNGVPRTGPVFGPQAGPAGTFGTISRDATNPNRGIRNNNPGNLNYAGQPGATREDNPNDPNHHEAIFPSMEMGIAAMANQLRLYKQRGLNTLTKMINTYAPSFENDTPGYIAQVARSLGIGADQDVNLDDPRVMKGIIRAMTNVEVGPGRITDAQIEGGLNPTGTALAANGRPPWYRPMPALPATGARAVQASRPENNRPNVSNTSATHVNGPITVNTQATDAAGVAGSLKRKLQDFNYVPQSNYGLA